MKAFKEKGFWVRALVRNPKALNQPGKHGAPSIESYVDEMFQGEVTQPEMLKGVCDGIDFVFSSIGITRQKDGAGYKDVDYQGNVNLLLEAEASGVEKFMYISVFKGDEIHGTLNDWKERFVQRLKQSKLDHVVVRPTGYFSDMGEFLDMALKGRVSLIGNGTKKMNPIHGADLANFCVEGLSQANAELDVGGPQVFTHREIAKLAFLAADRPEKITCIPSWLFRAGISPLKIFSPNNYEAVEFLCNVMMHDMVAPRYGTRDLRGHFEQIAEKRLFPFC